MAIITEVTSQALESSAPTLQSAVVAIVEDDPQMSRLIADMLSALNVNAEVFELGANLLQSESLRRVTALVLDLSIPDMDGFEIMDQLAIKRIGIPMVLISGHDHAVLHAAKLYGRGLGLNVRSALAKPFAGTDLLGALGLGT